MKPQSGLICFLPALFIAAGCDRPSAKQTPTQIHAAGTALDSECNHSGPNPDGSVQFITTCPQTARSPDGHWKLVQTNAAGDDEAYQVYIVDAAGRTVGNVTGLNDGMPFVLYWSPRSDWFAVSHHVGSFLDQPEIFEISGTKVRRRDELRQAGAMEVRRRYPCLPEGDAWLTGGVMSWSKDGRSIAWYFTTRPDTCYEDKPLPWTNRKPGWESLLLISNVETGAVATNSVRVLNDETLFVNLRLPTDGPCVDF